MKSAALLLIATQLIAATSDDVLAAAKKGNVELVKTILDSNPELVSAHTAGGVSAILLAIYSRHPDVVPVFLSHGATLTFAEACGAGRIDDVRAYLKRDPKLVDSFSPDGFPVLGMAGFFGHPDVARLLIESGANVNLTATNSQKVAIIHSFVAADNVDLTRLLIFKGANVNVPQSGGFTPLHEAAANGNRAMAELLLQAGADLNAKTDDGKTAVDFAESRGKKEVAAWLRSLGK